MRDDGSIRMVSRIKGVMGELRKVEICPEKEGR